MDGLATLRHSSRVPYRVGGWLKISIPRIGRREEEKVLQT